MVFHDIITEKKSPEVKEIAICNKKFGYLFFQSYSRVIKSWR